MFFTFVVDSCILGTVWPRLSAIAVLFVFVPFTYVGGPVEMGESTITVSHIVLPVTSVYVQVSVKKATPSEGLVVFPISLVETTIWPLDNSFTLLNFGSLNPLTSVFGTRFNYNFITLFPLAECLFKFSLIVDKWT